MAGNDETRPVVLVVGGDSSLKILYEYVLREHAEVVFTDNLHDGQKFFDKNHPEISGVVVDNYALDERGGSLSLTHGFVRAVSGKIKSGEYTGAMIAASNSLGDNKRMVEAGCTHAVPFADKYSVGNVFREFFDNKGKEPQPRLPDDAAIRRPLRRAGYDKM